jgi:dihydrofolate reductase
MQGGTTFHFVTDGIHAALARAKEAADGKDVRLGGGVSTMSQYLRAGLVDDMHFVISPALIGSGERLFQDLDLPALGYELKGYTPSPGATHIKIGKRA